LGQIEQAMIDRDIKRLLLKPLASRKDRALDPKAYSEALARLDQRALGELLVRRRRSALDPSQRKEGKAKSKDPARAREIVEMAKALYASRRISTQEYILYAASPVEDIHSARWFDGHYDAELASINRALDTIRKKHRLGPDEDWHRGDGPKEHIQLNTEYETILDQKFIEALEEFGLPDLAKLKKENAKKFDRLRERGRRAVFHRDEFSFVVHDAVTRYEIEARQAASAGAYSAAIICLGSAIEGLLLLRCLRSKEKAERISKTLPRHFRPRSTNDASTWTFETLIETCLAAGWLPPVETSLAQYDVASLAHSLRSMRNYVHPGRRVRHRPWSEADERDYQDAYDIYAVLFSILSRISSKKPNADS
jgi:hypothetical protein